MNRTLCALVLGISIAFVATGAIAQQEHVRKFLRRGEIYTVTLASDADVIRGTTFEGVLVIRLLDFVGGPRVRVHKVTPGRKEEEQAPPFWLNLDQVVTVETAIPGTPESRSEEQTQ